MFKLGKGRGHKEVVLQPRLKNPAKKKKQDDSDDPPSEEQENDETEREESQDDSQDNSQDDSQDDCQDDSQAGSEDYGSEEESNYLGFGSKEEMEAFLKGKELGEKLKLRTIKQIKNRGIPARLKAL